MACSTNVVRYVSKNGRMAGGSSTIVRSAMNLWTVKPQACAGTGLDALVTSTRSATGIDVRMTVHYTRDASHRRAPVHFRRTSERRRSRGSERVRGAADLHEVGWHVTRARAAGRR